MFNGSGRLASLHQRPRGLPFDATALLHLASRTPQRVPHLDQPWSGDLIDARITPTTPVCDGPRSLRGGSRTARLPTALLSDGCSLDFSPLHKRILAEPPRPPPRRTPLRGQRARANTHVNENNLHKSLTFEFTKFRFSPRYLRKN
jgi:hypothetical protein